MVSPPKEEWRDDGLIKHNLVRPIGLIECDTVLDIGAGLRPMQWYQPAMHNCVDAFQPYCDKLNDAGYHAFCETAKKYLTHTILKYEAIYLLDVIEHMEKTEGEEVVKLAQELATKQVVIFTPFGFMEQSGDAWGLGGDYWQTHRSGWLPEEFPDWHTYRHGKGFFAIWTPTAN